MEEFLRKFTQLNREMVKIIITHRFFDEQVFYCDELQTINDDDRVGVVIKGREIFVYKQDITIAEAKDYMYTISDSKLTIKVIINKL
jgi:hypothetical protein